MHYGCETFRIFIEQDPLCIDLQNNYTNYYMTSLRTFDILKMIGCI